MNDMALVFFQPPLPDVCLHDRSVVVAQLPFNPDSLRLMPKCEYVTVEKSAGFLGSVKNALGYGEIMRLQNYAVCYVKGWGVITAKEAEDTENSKMLRQVLMKIDKFGSWPKMHAYPNSKSGPCGVRSHIFDPKNRF